MKLCKFRAWDKENKRFVYFCNGTYYIKSDCDLPYRCSKNIFNWNNAEQYIGLKDGTKWEDLTEKERESWTRYGRLPSDFDGKEIYEGDILKFDSKEWGSDKGIFIVEWDVEESKFSTGGGTQRETGKFKTIIGNIHENKDLLNE